MAPRIPDCKCDTGSYCHLHKTYRRLSDNLTVRLSQVEIKSEEMYRARGRRVVRKWIDRRV